MSEKQEGLQVTGKVNAKDEYEGKNGISYTLHIAIQGLQNMIPVRVPASLFHKIEAGTPFDRSVTFKETKWGFQFALAS